jgi:hypothetical protein
METNYRNKNRGYQQLRVWQDAIEFYVLNSRAFRRFPYELKRVASQAITSSESLERKQDACDWIDTLVVKESNVAYS